MATLNSILGLSHCTGIKMAYKTHCCSESERNVTSVKGFRSLVMAVTDAERGLQYIRETVGV